MKRVSLIQFNKEHDNEYGHYPEVGKFYKLREYEDTYDLEQDDDEGQLYTEELPAISIIIPPNKYTKRSVIGYIVNGQDTEHTIIDVELDDDSQLFKT